MLSVFTDDFFMEQAMKEASRSVEENEVPVGAVIVTNNKIIARAYNRIEALQDVTAHAEMLAITAASTHLGSKYLNECVLYVTLEPCPMCASALRYAQIGRVVYAAADEKSGFMRFGKSLLHPKTKIEYGLKENDSVQMMRAFFKERRRI